MVIRNRATEALNPLLKERLTTMPRLDGQTDPLRPPGGHPKEPLDLLMKLVFDSDKRQLCLQGPLSETQRREDGIQWFKDATTYVERTAMMHKQRPLLFQGVPWEGKDLQTRLARALLLEVLVERGQAFVELLSDTLKVERADLMRMSDVLVSEVEAQLARPTLDAALRSDLENLASVPLQLWRERQAEIQKIKSDNAGLRDEVSALRQKLGATEAELRDLRERPLPLSVEPTLSKRLAAPQPAKTKRRAKR